jgi:hypothetical protein
LALADGLLQDLSSHNLCVCVCFIFENRNGGGGGVTVAHLRVPQIYGMCGSVYTRTAVGADGK